MDVRARPVAPATQLPHCGCRQSTPQWRIRQFCTHPRPADEREAQGAADNARHNPCFSLRVPCHVGRSWFGAHRTPLWGRARPLPALNRVGVTAAAPAPHAGGAPHSSFFLQLYAEGRKAPWDIGEAQPALVAACDAGLLGPVGSKVLDVGCGPGDNAIFLASRGYHVTAVDLSADIVVEAARRAEAAGPFSGSVTFSQGDVFAHGFAPGTFTTLLDSAVFHCIGDDDAQTRYIASISTAIASGGRLLMLAFSDKNQDPWQGPRRISREHARAMWEGSGFWTVGEFVDTEFKDHMSERGPRYAIRMTATRL